MITSSASEEEDWAMVNVVRWTRERSMDRNDLSFILVKAWMSLSEYEKPLSFREALDAKREALSFSSNIRASGRHETSDA